MCRIRPDIQLRDGSRSPEVSVSRYPDWKLSVLTQEEFVVAMLANRGWMNVEIAEHMGIEQNQLNRTLKAIYKLGIANRRQLKKYMLQ